MFDTTGSNIVESGETRSRRKKGKRKERVDDDAMTAQKEWGEKRKEWVNFHQMVV